MDGNSQTTTDTFVQVSEVWIPDGDRLVLAAGDYGGLAAFEAESRAVSFAKGEGLPGKAWAEARPVVLKGFDGSYFKRIEAAREAGLTAAVAIPVFAGAMLKAVLVVLCGDDETRVGAIEVWTDDRDGLMMLEDGYYGAAKEFEFVSQHTHFPKGQGLPGGVWAAATPILLRELGSGYRFVRASAADKAGLTTGLGLPVPVPGGKSYVVTLLSALGTPIARRFEIWSVRHGKDSAVLIDGICEREGTLWRDDGTGEPEDRPTATAWKGPVGQVLGSGLPAAERGIAGLPKGYEAFTALPIHQGGFLTHIVALYI